MRALAGDGRELVVWWATLVECVSAVARGERRGDVAPEQATLALATFDGLAEVWREVPPTERIRQTARRLVSVHDVRTADAFQLAAAHATSDERPDRLPFVTLDSRLALAARREGFPVLP